MDYLSSLGFSLDVFTDAFGWPIHKVSLEGIPEEKLTIICYGGMTSVSLEVSKKVFVESEWSVDIIIPSFISEPSKDLINCIMESQPNTILFLSESTDQGDFMRSLHSSYIEVAGLDHPYKRVLFENSSSSIVPSSEEKEKSTLPSVDGIVNRLL